MIDNIKNNSWRLRRKLGLSELVQLILLGSLIIGSWANIQHQLDMLGYDVGLILKCQEDFQQRIEKLQVASIKHECRLRFLEKNNLSKGSD